MSASHTLKARFDADGFVVIRNFLSAESLDSLLHELDVFIREVVPTYPAGHAIYEDPARPETLRQLTDFGHHPFFDACKSDPYWKATAEMLLGEPVCAHHAEWFNKPPGTNHATPPHQDNYYFCLTPPNVLTMWLAHDEVDEENGCLKYVRGSHLRGIRPHYRTNTLGFSQGIVDFGEPDVAQEVSVYARPGDVLVHHGNTIHRADVNRSVTRHRRSFAIVFQGESCRRDISAFQRYQQQLAQLHQQMGVT